MSILSTNEAIDLINCLKYLINTNKDILLPAFGSQLQLDVTNYDKTKKFIVDINRKGYKVSQKLTLQLRYNEVLVRVDYGGTHTNPDGTLLDEPHIHIYKEGYGARWAYPLFKNQLYTMSINFDESLYNLVEVIKEFLELIKIDNIYLYNIYNTLI